MPVHLLLTQTDTPAITPAGVSPAPGDGLGLRHFDGLEPAGSALHAQYLRQAPPRAAVVAGAAQYGCVEVSDSGATQAPAPVLMIVAFDVPPELQPEVERWYNEEHIPLLRRAPGWERARRYQVLWQAGGPRWTSIALHELRDAAVLDSQERAYARSTPWRARLSSQAWFVAAGRFLYRQRQGKGHGALE
ncbi:MAG: hypothetical protein QM718_03995 [Steroidobacteraceae bacterium]